MNLLCRSAPVNAAVFFFQGGGLSGQAVILFNRGQLVLSEKIKGLHEGSTAQFGELGKEAACSFVTCHRDGGGQEHGPGVHSHVHLHDGHTRLLVTFDNGPLDGCSASVAGEE